MQSAEVFLNGIPVLADGPVVWAEQTGPEAPLKVFRVNHRVWPQIERQIGGEVTLSIESATAPTLEIKRLLLVKEAPTNEPYTRSVIVSDLRFWWPYRLIHRDYNVVRKTGSRRLVGDSIIELAQGVDSFTYAKWSLDENGDRWTARSFVADVFGQLAAHTGSGLSIENLPQDEDETGFATIQNLLLSENGASAAARALGTIRGLDVAITKNGDIRLFDATDYPQTEAILDGRITTTIGSQVRLVGMAGIRPKRVLVYFEREVEVRFDSREEDESPTQYATGGGVLIDANPICDNVLSLPDPETQIDGDTNGWAQGAWATVKQAVDAWDDQFPKANGEEVSLRAARANWWRLHSHWTLLADPFPASEKAAWSARVSTLLNHYRRTYRLPREWMEHIRDVRGYRVNVLDPLTRTRGPAQAWGSYCVIPSQKYTLQVGQSNPTAALAQNIDGYPGYSGELHDKPASPCIVRVLDPQLGILHLDWQTDPYEMRMAVHPSMYKPLGGGLPSAPSRDFRESRMAWDSSSTSTVPLVLADDHRVAMLVTCVPGSPNDKRRLFRVDVYPHEVQNRLGAGINATGHGPDFEVYVSPNEVTAWYAWRKTQQARETAKELMGIVEAGDDPRDGYEVLNDGPDSVLRAVAEAKAISIWSTYADAMEGNPSYHMAPDLQPVGNVASVAHGIDGEGRLFSIAAASAQRRPLDPMAYIPAPVRTLVVHRVPDGSVM